MLNSVETISGESATIRLDGELTAGSLDEIRERLKGLIAGGLKTVILDMTLVGSIDSSGVGFIAALYNSLTKAGGVLELTGLSEEMYNFLVSLRLNSRFKIEKCN